MIERLRSRWVFGGAALLILLSVACVRIAPEAWSRMAAPPDDLKALEDAGRQAQPATPAGQAAPGLGLVTGQQAVAVKRGSITEFVNVTGRLAGQEEVPLSLPAPGRVQVVNVKAGQTVKAGDMLLELDSRPIQRDLSAARARLDADVVRLRQMQTEVQNRQRQAERERQLTQAGNQRALAEAEAALVRTTADLARVRAGALPADREAADAAVVAARAALERAEADLARLSAGPSEADLAGAQQQVTASRLTLQKAEADLAKLQRGADPAAVRTAERELAAAQAEFERAQGELNALTGGPDPYEVRAAEREVERAQIALRAAETIPADDASRASRETLLGTARLGLKEAQERLARLREPPRPSAVEVARRNVDNARLGVEGAKERLEAAKRGPDQLTVDTAQAAVEGARLGVQSAETRLQALQQGPPQDQISAATNAVNAARSAVGIAEARRAELLSHPTEAELREAQNRLTAAQAAYDRIAAELRPLTQDVDPRSYEVQLLEQTVANDRGQVELIERELAATRLQAPFDGTVVAVHVRSGDPLEPAQPAIVLTKPGEVVVKAEVGDREGSKLVQGQEATVQPEGKGVAPISAVLASLSGSETGLGLALRFQLGLPEGMQPPPFGTAAQVAIKVSQKDGVLLIPEKAVNSAGARRWVEYLDGTTKRIADVQLGLSSGGEVEVLDGLQEGQTIVVRQ
ncbi:MAG TPA: biotin/lipoyl-binding protein [Chloroflexota bacterium]|nr:biotin/lipoyl-binding protein [Chloroflexota bacterium]